MKWRSIEEVMAKEYQNIDTNKYIWNELIKTPIEYGNGWYNLIIELITKIEGIYLKNNKDITEIEIIQIKEKYGSLRIYITSSISEVHDLIVEYERLAETICDECGNKGSLRQRNDWLQILCEECASLEGYQKIEEKNSKISGR